MLDYLFNASLLLISSNVAYGLYLQKNMWVLIVAYWITLSLKNFYITVNSLRGDKK